MNNLIQINLMNQSVIMKFIMVKIDKLIDLKNDKVQFHFIFNDFYLYTLNFNII